MSNRNDYSRLDGKYDRLLEDTWNIPAISTLAQVKWFKWIGKIIGRKQREGINPAQKQKDIYFQREGKYRKY